jgi:hypothetical protein
MSKRDYSIYDFLDKVEKRSGMYIGDVTLKNLSIYLNGFNMAMINAEVKDISNPDFYSFNNFIKEKFGYSEPTAGWANMILAVSIGLTPKNVIWENYDTAITDEQHIESVKLFYKLLHEFRQIG